MKIKVISLLLMLTLTAAVGVYVRNGMCFWCAEWPDNCSHHMGPCDILHASVQDDECRNDTCPVCTPCRHNGPYNCCYYGSFMCTDDAHIGQTMYDRSCHSPCYAYHNGPAPPCPEGMLCE